MALKKQASEVTSSNITQLQLKINNIAVHTLTVPSYSSSGKYLIAVVFFDHKQKDCQVCKFFLRAYPWKIEKSVTGLPISLHYTYTYPKPEV